VPRQLKEYLEVKNFYEAVKLLQESIELLKSDEIKDIGALRDLREEIYGVYDVLFHFPSCLLLLIT